MCVAATLVRWVQNVNPEDYGVRLRFHALPRGLYRSPFVIDFSQLLRQMSGGQVDIQALNAYVVGDFTQPEGRRRSWRYSNFLDPHGPFKDSWFGVYIILDDVDGRGRRFMLTHPEGPAGDFENLRPAALRAVPMLDQKLIVWSTHERQAGYSFERFEEEFYFDFKPGSELVLEELRDTWRRRWLRLSSVQQTIAAVTDTRLTRMAWLTSLRSHIGLPTEEVYRLVRPWHPVEIKGAVTVRYFEAATRPFWAIAYYNGCAFETEQGEVVDTWQDGALRRRYEQMFMDLDLRAVKNYY